MGWVLVAFWVDLPNKTHLNYGLCSWVSQPGKTVT